MAPLMEAARGARKAARLTARAAANGPHRFVSTLRRFWSALGPGVVAGAADDDPSGIATYSVAGAQFGSAFLGTALITWPVMAAMQFMCARIGMVTGKGLMGALEEKLPRPLWRASQEVEQEKALGRHSLVARRDAAPGEIGRRRMDVGVGTFFSNVAMFFIILTTAVTLHAAGVTRIETSRDVARALEPLAGHWATLLYTVGIVGVGALAIPTLAGSAAYASAALLGWRQGIDEHFRGAPAFYAVILVSLAAGVAVDFANVNAVRALYWTAVVNGVLAPFLLVGLLAAASDTRLMQGQPSSRLGRAVVGTTAVAMFGAAAGMFIF